MKKKDKITITLDNDLSKQFKKFCKKYGMTVSGRISVLIKRELKGGVKK